MMGKGRRRITHMTRMSIVAIVVVLSILPARVADAQRAAATSITNSSGLNVVPVGKDPFSGIFTRPAGKIGSAAAPSPRTTATIVCGMTVVHVDPKLDPRILVEPKRGPSLQPKARI